MYIRLQISRGGGRIGLDVGLADRAEFVLLVQPCPGNSTDVTARGLRLSVAVLTKVAGSAGLRSEEAALRLSDLARFDECFVLSTTKDITPVSAADDVQFKTGGRYRNCSPQIRLR